MSNALLKSSPMTTAYGLSIRNLVIFIKGNNKITIRDKINLFYKIYDALCVDIFKYICH